MKLYKLVFIIFATTALLSFASVSAKANTIYSNFGPSDSYYSIDDSNGWAVSGPSAFENYSIGASFIPTIHSYLNSIDVAVEYHNGNNLLEAQIKSDSGGLPGLVIEAFSVASVPSYPGGIVSFSSSSIPLLQAGTTYWLTLSNATDGVFTWLDNDQGVIGTAYNDGSGWVIDTEFPSPAFRISGSPIPEPATMLLLGTGLVGVVGAARRKKKNQA